MMRLFWRDAMRNACLSLWKTQHRFDSPSATARWMSGWRLVLLFRGLLIEWALWALSNKAGTDLVLLMGPLLEGLFGRVY